MKLGATLALIDWSSPLVKGLIHMGAHLVALVVIVLNWLLDINSMWLIVLVSVVNLVGVVRSVLILIPYYARRRAIAAGSPRDGSGAHPLR